MKKILIFVFLFGLLVSLASSIAWAGDKIPNLVGHWHGRASIHDKKKGFRKGEEPVKFIIEKQKGRVFSGKKIYVANKKEITEHFSGVISIDNKKVYIAEHIDGLIIGDIVSKNKMAIYYIEDGEDAIVIINVLNRVKK